ncbi:DUF2937 family protein [Pseudomonas boanensis]|uniref:DUF2937 family protein n=1 Tax=Metapseudomonas boanensis TaxID=2822138 RepID=UPI0035D52434
MFRSYLRLILFTFGLLVGVQVPGFIDDYAKRVEAHRLEAEQGLKGFRATAKRFFKGDLDALVAHYRVSDDPVMRSDAQSVSSLVSRAQLLEREWRAMQGPWYLRAWHVVLGADPELRKETLAAYNYQVLLAPEAIAWGLGAGLLLAWLVESQFVLLGWAISGGRSRKVQERHWR